MQVGFLGLLTIVFITLKLLGYIGWSWWLIWSPLIVGMSVAFICLGLALILGGGVRVKWRKK